MISADKALMILSVDICARVDDGDHEYGSRNGQMIENSFLSRAGSLELAETCLSSPDLTIFDLVSWQCFTSIEARRTMDFVSTTGRLQPRPVLPDSPVANSFEAAITTDNIRLILQ